MNAAMLASLPGHLWRTGLLRLSPVAVCRIFAAWRRCPGSLAFLAEAAAVRSPCAVALCDDEGPMTFAALRDAYQSLAQHLREEFRLGPGRQVVLLARNDRSFVIGLLAAVRTGADVLLANPGSPAKLLDELLASRDVDLVLHGEDQALGPGAHKLPRLAIVSALYRTGGGPRCLPKLRSPGCLAVLTSGTTSRAKRVKRRPRLGEVLPATLGLLEALPISVGVPTVLAVPFFHGHGLATLAIALAFAAPLCTGRKYEVAPLISRCPADARPIVVSVPTLLLRWLETAPLRGSTRAVVSGSAPLHSSLARRLLGELGPVLFNLYGSSEAGIISLATPADLTEAPGSVGRPLPGNEVRIVEPDGRAVAPGKVGRIFVRGPLVLGVGSDGFADTGDVGYLDEAGLLFVCGRSDAMIVSGGENVYPQEVEACLLGHASIVEAAVIAVPDDEFGQRLRAFVVSQPGANFQTDVLRSWLSERLERCKMPRNITMLEALPRGPLGKIDRGSLREVPEI